MTEVEVDLESLEAKMEHFKEPKNVETIQKNEAPQVSEEKEEEPVLVVSPLDDLAKKHGWNPEGEKSAEEFISFALDAHPKRGKELKELKKTVENLVELNKRQHQAGYEAAARELEDQRRDAIVAGDLAAVEIMDQKIKSHQEEAPVEDPPEIHHSLSDFDARHSDWIGDAVSLNAHKMRQFAHQRGMDLAQTGMDPSEWVPILEQNLKEEFSDYFSPKKQKEEKIKMYPSVDQDGNSGTANKKSSQKFSFSDLTSEQKTIARQFERRGVMKAEEYINQLVEIGELR